MTKKEMFTVIRNYFENTADVFVPIDNTETIPKDDVLAFIDKEVELLDKRNSYKSKSNKRAEANQPIKDAIVEVLTKTEKDEGLTVSEITKTPEIQAFNTEGKVVSGNKVTALLVQLRKDGIVKREYVKKVAYFSLGKETVAEVEED